MIIIPAKYLSSIDIGGLEGRLLDLPPKNNSKLEILMLYGLHSSLERMYTYAQFHSRYGRVLMPDLPGFGGMDNFYKIDRVPDLDSYADYLYTFIKTYRLEKKEICIVGMSFGFLAVTRLLQKHPELTDNIKFVISFVGFGQTSDFAYPILGKTYVRRLNKFASSKSGAALISFFVFNKLSLRLMFAVFRLSNPKYKYENKDEQKEATAMELDLWTKNDTRTRFFVYNLLSNFDLTKGQEKINLTGHNLTTDKDQYFDPKRVKSTLSKLYKKNYDHRANMPLHAPSIIGTEEEVADIFSESVKDILSK